MKPFATAFRLKLYVDKIKDEEKKKDIQRLIATSYLFRCEIYLAKNTSSIKVIEGMGFRLHKKGEYYVLPWH